MTSHVLYIKRIEELELPILNNVYLVIKLLNYYNQSQLPRNIYALFIASPMLPTPSCEKVWKYGVPVASSSWG